MYVEPVFFQQKMPIAYSAYKLGFYHLHCHVGVIEVLMVIRGSAIAKVSFEEFRMVEGDYVVINSGDSHSIYATDSKCQVISLYFKMDYFKNQIPFLEYVIFACESFDLVKYKNETQYLRRIISVILSDLIVYYENKGQCEESKNNLVKKAEELLWIFVNDYDMKNYYNRNWDASYSKTEIYYTIMKYIFENYYMSNIINYISENEHYTKSYLTRLYKEIGGSGFQDTLSYVRIYKSEMLLLNSDITIAEISDMCGFSDIKYYNSNFKNWFLCTPFEYRKMYQPEVAKPSICQTIQKENIIEMLDSFKKKSYDKTEYKAAITPINIKSNSNLKHIFQEFDKDETLQYMKNHMSNIQTRSIVYHRIYLEICENNDINDLTSIFLSFKEKNFKPVLLINFKETTMKKCIEMIECCADIFTQNKFPYDDMEILILYNSISDIVDINKVLEENNWPDYLNIMPVMIA